MNHYLREYLIKIWCVLFYRRHHTFDVKTCFQQNRYVFDVIMARRTACTEFFSWFQWIQTVFKINTIIYRNKLFTDEFHYFKWIITCTEIVYIYNNAIIYTKSIRIWRHYDVMRVICFLYIVEFCPRYFDGFRRN
jgi:hypothetical protein